jgi:hypothetical protein
MRRFARGSFDAPPSWRDDLSIRMATSDLLAGRHVRERPFPDMRLIANPHGVEVLATRRGGVRQTRPAFVKELVRAPRCGYARPGRTPEVPAKSDQSLAFPWMRERTLEPPRTVASRAK